MTERNGHPESPDKSIEPTWIEEAHESVFRSDRVSVGDYALVVVEGPHAGDELVLSREMLHIGRGSWCDLSLRRDRRISKHHCSIRLSPEGFRIHDKGSRNGIYLGEFRVFDACLVEGASLTIGDSVMTLQSRARQTEIQVPYFDQSKQLVGRSERMRELFSLMARLGPRNIPLLLMGETGTGKTQVARALHDQSHCAEGPFVVVNCGALPASLIEASLFGYEKGAFTNAAQQHRGYFEQAKGGTLFLDEIGELPLSLQPKLLDVLERKKIRRLGSEHDLPIEFRLITATHQNVAASIAEGSFREDLYYRLAVMELFIPPLRERLEDLPLLIEHILEQLHPEETIQITPKVLGALEDFLWPGNVRQLRNVLERSLVFLEGQLLDLQALQLPKQRAATVHRNTPTPAFATNTPAPAPPTSPASQEISATSEDNTEPVDLGSFKQQQEQAERQILLVALEEASWDVAKAARQLNTSKSWLYGRIKRYGLQKAEE